MARSISRASAGRSCSSTSAATCSLLGAAPGPTLAQEEPRRWSYDTALLYYGEQQGRVHGADAESFLEAQGARFWCTKS